MAKKNNNNKTVLLIVLAVIIIIFLKSNTSLLSFLEYGATYDYSYEPFQINDFVNTLNGDGSCITYNSTYDCSTLNHCALYNTVANSGGKWGTNYGPTSSENYYCNITTKTNYGRKNPIINETGGTLILTTNLSGGDGFNGTTLYSSKDFRGYDMIISLTTNCDSRSTNYTSGGCAGAVRFSGLGRRMIPQTDTTTDVIYELRWNLSSLTGSNKQYAIFENGQLIYHSNTSSSFYIGVSAYQEIYGPTPGYIIINYLKYKLTGDKYPGYYYSPDNNNCTFIEVSSEDKPYNSTFIEDYNDCYSLIQPSSYNGYLYSYSLNTCTQSSVLSKTSPYNSTFTKTGIECYSMINTYEGNRIKQINIPSYLIPVGQSKDYEIVFDVERITSNTTAEFDLSLIATGVGTSNSITRDYVFQVPTPGLTS